MLKIMRILLALLPMMIIISNPYPTAAEVNPTMVILDTALDTSIPEIKENLVYEVCILDWNSCPNGTDFMEGPGASTMPKTLINQSGFGHGTQMTSAAIRTYPDLKLIFIRIIAHSASGARLSTSEGTVARALDWVYKYKERFNIVSVGLAQSHHRLWSGKQYCPISTRNNEVIRKLFYAGIPLFVASGNDNDKSRVSWPACIPEAMAVSAITNQTISRYSNFDKDLSDFAAIGEMRVYNAGGSLTNASGTSISAQVMAALWTRARVEFPQFSFQDTFDFLQRISKLVRFGSSEIKWVTAETLDLEIFKLSVQGNGITQLQVDELIRCALVDKSYSNLTSLKRKQQLCAK
jgi:hypothetical protein